ncbi:DUF3634 family protein [Planctomicrobium sp. SH661]|uniref:DUF3634 family protein n=1 Tax=Planctomicrobium sp. SH661 TaxID=3448124 RepID=UPI003F5C3833
MRDFLWIAAIATAAAVAFGAVKLGFVPPPNARSIFRIRDGVIRVQRGHLRYAAKESLTEVLAAEGVNKGFIAITSGGRVTFSREIPSSVHQKIRNVLLNEGA